jgi:catechol 2,3-dioxygenase-like lactoylglutathione lyase family enzyme
MTQSVNHLSGVHHTARPTFKLRETVEFYRDILGLPVFHAISAVGWGPEDHPDFLHFFFDSGNGSTIAFFYYLGQDPLPDPGVAGWLYNSAHTAWRVESHEQLLAWKVQLEERGVTVRTVRHEIIESIYFTDPNGYLFEITWQVREIDRADQLDAELTLEAAIAVEIEKGGRATEIESIWRKKADLVTAHLAKVA